MSAPAVTRLARPPQMRRLLESQIKRALVGATVSAIVGALAFKYGIGEKRRQRYAEFYRNYDPEAEFEKMRQKGVFKSC